MREMKKFLICLILIIIVIILSVFIYPTVVKDSNMHNENKIINEEKQTRSIQISIYDKDNNEIYLKEVNTDKEYLSDVLTENTDINLVVENNQYGDYIVSILDIKQEEGYYWVYYINGECATEGISSCKINENSLYSFKIEKFQ